MWAGPGPGRNKSILMGHDGQIFGAGWMTLGQGWFMKLTEASARALRVSTAERMDGAQKTNEKNGGRLAFTFLSGRCLPESND